MPTLLAHPQQQVQHGAANVAPISHHSAASGPRRSAHHLAGEPRRGGPALANRGAHPLPRDPKASPNPGGSGHEQRPSAAPSDNSAHRRGCSPAQHARDGAPITNGDRTAQPPQKHRQTAPGRGSTGQPSGTRAQRRQRALIPSNQGMKPITSRATTQPCGRPVSSWAQASD